MGSYTQTKGFHSDERLPLFCEGAIDSPFEERCNLSILESSQTTPHATDKESHGWIVFGELDKEVDIDGDHGQSECLDVLVFGWNGIGVAMQPETLSPDCAQFQSKGCCASAMNPRLIGTEDKDLAIGGAGTIAVESMIFHGGVFCMVGLCGLDSIDSNTRQGSGFNTRHRS